jgi:hypothetical protein
MFAGANLKVSCDKCKEDRYFHKGESIDSIRCPKCGAIATIWNLDRTEFTKED